MKALLTTNDDRILGFTMIGPEAGEVVAVVQTAMLADRPYSKLHDAVITHPTMAEALNLLFSNVPRRPLDDAETGEQRFRGLEIGGGEPLGEARVDRG